MAYGTLSVSDLLATTQQSVAEVGEQQVFQAINDALVFHNSLVAEKLGTLVERSTDRQRRYGGPAAMSMDFVDEFGRADAQKIGAGITVGFPLRLAEVSIQWTRKYMQNNSPAELTAQFQAAQDADAKILEKSIKQALFTPTNSTFIDRLVDNVSLAVKALLNADGADIPLGPNGDVTFDPATHSHYNTSAALDVAAMNALIDDVVEHHATGAAQVYINIAQEATVRALTGFVAYLDPRIIPAQSTTTARGTLNMLMPHNRAIGVFGSAEVWVKPWVPATYLFAYVAGAPSPLVMRERPGSGGLVIAAEDENYPLRARTMEREFGVGVFERTNGACLQITAGAYSAPTFV